MFHDLNKNSMPAFDNEFLSLLVAGGFAFSAIRRPARAISIALRSRFAFKPVPESLRHEDINLLKRKISDKDFGKRYLVVTGENGVGTTCLLSTVTSKTPGVINVLAMSSHSEKTIIRNTLQELINYSFSFLRLSVRVIFWYRLFTLGRSPIVVIKAVERKNAQDYTDLISAAQTLVDDYKLRVIVDGPPNLLDDRFLRTSNRHVFKVKPMTREMIWQIDELQGLFKYIKEAGLDDLVFAVFGGVPASYVQLWENNKIDVEYGQNIRQVIGAHLCAKIFAAINLVQKSRTETADMKEIIKLFDKSNKWILCETLSQKKLQRPASDIMFREEERDGMSVLIPVSNAIGIVLQHSLTKKPSLRELEELINTKNGANEITQEFNRI